MSKQNEAITAVYADEDGNILDAPGMRGMGRTGRMNVLLKPEDLIPLPESADLMLLPDRLAVGQSTDGETMPISGLAVAAILPAGYTRLYMPAYERAEEAQRLPLYGYTAVVVYRDELYCAAVYTDENEKWDPVHYNTKELAKLVKRTKKDLPGNRIVEQVGGCSLKWHGAEPLLPPLGVRHPDIAGLQRELLRLHLTAAGRVLPFAAGAHQVPSDAGGDCRGRHLPPLRRTGRHHQLRPGL